MKVLLADDHAMVRDGLRAILERHGVQVVGEAASGREAIALAESARPDVVVMDVTMPDLNGIDAARRIVAEHPAVKVIGLSMHSDPRYVAAMLSAGARGYLLKDAASSELLDALAVVAQNRTYVSPAITGAAAAAMGHAGAPGSTTALTHREREVLQLLAEGHTSKEIGTRLAIALPTVETHRRQIMKKLGIRTIAELTKFAVREGLTSLEK